MPCIVGVLRLSFFCFKQFFLFICVKILSWLCVPLRALCYFCVCFHVCLWVCSWKPEVNPRCCFLGILHLGFLRHVLSLTWGFPNRPEWARQWAPGTSLCPPPQCRGYKLRSSHLFECSTGFSQPSSLRFELCYFYFGRVDDIYIVRRPSPPEL